MRAAAFIHLRTHAPLKPRGVQEGTQRVARLSNAYARTRLPLKQHRLQRGAPAAASFLPHDWPGLTTHKLQSEARKGESVPHMVPVLEPPRRQFAWERRGRRGGRWLAVARRAGV